MEKTTRYYKVWYVEPVGVDMYPPEIEINQNEDGTITLIFIWDEHNGVFLKTFFAHYSRNQWKKLDESWITQMKVK